MIDVCKPDAEDEGPFGHAAFLSQLEQHGASLRRVAHPTDNVCILFAPLGADVVAALTPEVRRHVVLIAEGGVLDADAAEAMRNAEGLLGLVDPNAWRNWRRGLFVAWGLHGSAEIATAAGMSAVDTRGLQPERDTVSLPTLVARFVVAADDLRGS